MLPPIRFPRFILAGLAAVGLFSHLARAEYSYFSDVQSGSDIVVKEVRWPYWNNTYYNTWWSDNWTSTEGTSGYFYNGLALPAAGSPNPVGTPQTVNWSFWPLSNPVKITDTITPFYTSPSTFAMPTIGEGTILRSPGKWSLWQTNVWYRMVIRTWLPVSGAPHSGFAGTWLRDPVAGVWYHLASIQLPFAVTGIDGSMGFQENATGGTQPQRTDYRGSYYHKNGAWNSSTNFYVYVHAGSAIENAGLIETNTAVYYETCKSNGVYTGTLTTGQTSPTYHITQPATPWLDPIIVSNCSASVSGGQLLVQWQTLSNSSPQFSYRIDVYTNAGYTGNIVATASDIDPEARQKLVTLGNVATPYARLTIIDIFSQTNAPINIAPTNATLNAATSVPGAVNGLNFSYYQSATSYTTDSSTNWSSMPNFASLAPVSSGAVSGLDLTPQQRRNGYAFNYTGYLNVASNGLYAFTLNSDGGSKLSVDGQWVVNNDGDHSPADASGWVGLQAGLHTLNVQYFFDTQPTSLFSDYFDTLALACEGPGLAKSAVPVTAFYRVPGGSEPSLSLVSPTNGAVLSGASVPLTASVTANGNTINNVRFYVGDNYWAQDSTAPYSLSSFFWENPGNAVHARLIYNTTNLVDSAVNWVNTTNMSVAPWQFGQIFYHNYPSGVSIQGGTYSVIGDGVNLLTRQISGDCTLIAHLAGLPGTAAKPDGSTPNSGWQAGIILRGNTNMVPGYPWGYTNTAPFTAVFGQVGGGAYYQDETMVNGGGGYSSGSLGSQKWFKLQRVGNTFTSSVSADGTTWTAVKTNSLADFGSTIYAGFFTFAGPSANPSVHWASFDSVSLTGNLVGPPGVTVVPASDTAYTGQTSTFTATPSGNAPFTYQWQFNGVTISGATNAALTLTNLPPAASGYYTVLLSNASGTATATAVQTVLSPPPATAQILSNSPAGYWRLNETAGPTAYDSAGGFNGTGEGGILFAVPGVTNSPFSGFESGNLAAQFNGTDSDVAIPALNVTTTNFTVTGWVRCNGAQVSNAGLVFSRGSGYGTGLMAVNNGANLELRYSWNDNGADYGWSTGLNLPTNNVWTYLALTVEPTRTIVYMATNSVLLSKTNSVTNSGRTLAGNFYFGYDPNSSTRRLNGALDEIAIYNRTLTAQQLGQILAASQQIDPAVSLISPAGGANYGAPANVALTASVSTNGHAINYVQFYNGTSLLGTSSNAPFSFNWTNVPAGVYTLFAQLNYDTGGTLGSAPALISVNPIPAPPATVTATALATNLVSVVWSAAAYATGYTVSRNGTPIATVSATNYLDLGLAAGSNYCYSVSANNSYGASGDSVSSCVNTPVSGGALAWAAGGAAAGARDGNGNWGSSSVTWWDGAANVVWSNSKLAIFGAGTATNCTVVITNDVTPSGILFNANSGGTYDLTSSANGASHLVLAGTTTITANDDAMMEAYLNGSGSLVKAGPGTLTLTGGNTNTGAIIVKSGRLVATGGGWYGNRSIGSGSLTVSNGAVAEFAVAHGFGYGTGGYAATLAGGTLQFDHENYVSGLTMTAGAVTGAGEVRTTGGTYSTLASASPSVIGLNINFVSAGIFNIARGSGAVDLLVSGPASNAGAFTKNGAGIMAVSGTWAGTGPTTISAGTLQLDGSLGTNTVSVANTATLAGVGVVNGATTISSGGALAPGDAGIGTLTVSNNLTLATGSKTLMEISRNGGVLTNDLAAISGALTNGGSLTVTNLGTNALALGDSIRLFKAGTYAGTFASLTLPALTNGVSWKTNTLATNGTLTVVVSAYTLAYAAGGNGTLAGSPNQIVNFNASGTAVTANPNSGYHFVNWSDGSGANPRTDAGVTNNLSVTANFAINSYTLTYIAVTNGAISGTSPQTVNYGGSGTAVSPVPAPGCSFVNWSDGSTASPRTDAGVTSNITVTANFVINSYTLTYAAGTNGALSGATNQVVNFGTNGSAVTANPNSGYHFVNWSDGSVANPRTDANVTNNLTVTANFVINSYTLTYAAGTNGALSGATNQVVNYGTNGSAVSAVADVGYAFTNWSDGSLTNPRTDVNVTNDVSVTANFVANPAAAVVLSLPTNGSSYVAPATVSLAAVVTTNGNVINAVQFYSNGTNLLAQVTNAPYGYAWTNVGAGNYGLVARVLYNGSASNDSSAVVITVSNAVVVPVISAGTVTLAGGNFNLSGTGGAGQSYVLEGATNLSALVWVPIVTNVADGAGVFHLADPSATNRSQFYRVRSP